MKIDKVAFEEWLANPVTEEVFRAFDRLGQAAKEKWVAQSWGAGKIDPLMLADLRARAEVVEDFRKVDFETLEKWLEDEK